MLAGLILPWPQPLSSACWGHELAPPRLPQPNPPPHCRMIGARPAASLDTVKLAPIVTWIWGKALLSTWPANVLVTVAMPPLSPSTARVTSHFTLGTFLGTLP